MTGLIRCPGCGLAHPDEGLPRPRDRAATGECAAEAAPVLAAFYGPRLLPLRQYVVDAFACQHPDASSRRGVQATALCLMTMDLYVECGQPVGEGAAMHQEMMRRHPDVFVALDAPDLTASLTHRHVSAAACDDWGVRAREWAGSVWDAWSPHHEQVRAWNAALVPHRLDRSRA